MDYQKAKGKKEAAEEALQQAKQRFKKAQVTLQEAEKGVNTAYEKLTSVMANHEAGEATDKDVKQAQKAYKRSQQAENDAKLSLDTKAKAVKLFERKSSEAFANYEPYAYEYYKNRAQDIALAMNEAIDAIEAASGDARQLRDEMESEGLRARYLPRHFEAVPVSKRHMGPNGSRLSELIEQLSDNQKVKV